MTIFFNSCFCYNEKVKSKKAGSFFCFSLLIFFCLSLPLTSGQTIDDMFAQLEKSFETKDIPAYLSVFSPETREKEKSLVSVSLNLWKMETIKFHKAYQGPLKDSDPNFFQHVLHQVLYQNSYSALIEIWKLELRKVGDKWQIQKKEVTESISSLYKIKIPLARAERVSSIKIEHVDIQLTFKDALLFYDNIPDMEIALVVIGKGHLFYSPSSSVEKHQLELAYKKDTIEDRLEYAFLRFSNSFFQNNIKIEKRPAGKTMPVTQAELERASSLYAKYYPRSFTIENSITGELLSFVPQGEQTVFDFKCEEAGMLTYIYSPFVEEEVNLCSYNPDRIINLYSPASEKNGKRFLVTFGSKFSVENCQIEVDFEPEKSYLSARAKIEVRAQIDSLNSLKFNFNPDLDILRIYDQEGHELFYTQDKIRKILYVYLLSYLPKEQSTSIEIYYRGVLRPPSLTTDVLPQASFEEKEVVIKPRYETYLFSQSAYWYPSSSEPDYFQAHLKIIVPPEYTCIANGEIIEQGKLTEIRRVVALEKMGSSFYVFKTKYPVKYISFIVGKLSKIQETSSSPPLQLFISSDVWSSRKWLLEESQAILQFYENLFGSFPYEKLDIITRVWKTGGGHSPASFIVLNEWPPRSKDGFLVPVNSPVDLSRWREYFIAHEIAHQWWGQAVSWASYHDIWLSEGLAQFSTVLYLKKKFGDRTFGNIIKKFSQWVEKKSKWGPITLGSRLSYLDYEAFQALIYNKTTIILNMLLEILGEEAFFNGLQGFFAAHKFRAARTSDFVQVMEKNSGKDLKSFFQGWFDLHTLPEIYVFNSVQKLEGEYLLKFVIRQAKNVFIFPLWLEWRESDKEVRQKVLVNEKNQEFEFRLKEKPSQIKINPDRAVPGKFL